MRILVIKGKGQLKAQRNQGTGTGAEIILKLLHRGLSVEGSMAMIDFI